MAPLSVEHIAATCIARQARTISRAVSGLFDEALRPLGIKTSQFNVLVATAAQGVATHARTCRSLHMDASTLSRTVDRMRRQGWLETVADEDQRAQPFRLTAAGTKLLRAAKPRWREAQARATELIGNRAAAELARIAARLQQG